MRKLRGEPIPNLASSGDHSDEEEIRVFNHMGERRDRYSVKKNGL